MAETFNICSMRTYNHPSPEDFALERIFNALSDPVRLEIVWQLSRVTEASCTELGCGRPKSSMSHHFRILREAGLVQTRVAGTVHQNTLRRTELNSRFSGLLDSVLNQMP
ncbi:ArsR/SmtB family transcription factor [Caballeronia sp. 15711]|jgi:DNA-binding transcriptional ArsR family regulator|uniref:ArsR/SmtB family transcription factor n=1 Tax=Caballeronia sp. 15711 TaxID=3391029 RepID=UPI0039E34159